jgi:hypothetical protein
MKEGRRKKEEGRRKKEEGRGLQDVDSDKVCLWGKLQKQTHRPNSKRMTCRGRGIKPPTIS